MKFPVGTKVFGIFAGKVHPAEVTKQSRQYKEFLRLKLSEQTISKHLVPLVIDLRPDDVYEDEKAAKKVLFLRKLHGTTIQYGDNDG